MVLCPLSITGQEGRAGKAGSIALEGENDGRSSGTLARWTGEAWRDGGCQERRKAWWAGDGWADAENFRSLACRAGLTASLPVPGVEQANDCAGLGTAPGAV